MTHSYTNPEDKFDAAYVEAQVTEGKKYYDEQGWGFPHPFLIGNVSIVV